MSTHSLRALVLALCLLLPLQGYSDDCDNPDPFHNSNRQRDFQALQEFVNSKRTISFEEKHSVLKFSGDVRAEYSYRTEKQDGRSLRGGKAKDSKGIPIGHNVFESEVNLRFDYKCDKTWFQVYLNLDDTWGIDNNGITCKNDPQGMFGSGMCDDICLKRAYMGYRIYEHARTTFFDVEIGRRPLSSIFNSDVEFKNRFDGILFKFSRNIEPSSNFYINAGPFLVDERVKYFAYVGETGWLNAMNQMVDIMYSFIDWQQHGKSRCGTENPRGTRFKVSEFSLAYNFKKEFFHPIVGKDIKAQVYTAWMINHAARTLRKVHSKENQAWYAGFLLGEMKKQGDWAFEVYYQWVQAQVCPDSDVSSDIDRGNVRKEFFYANGRGKTNFKGFAFEGIYAITNKLTIELDYNFARAADSRLGGKHSNSKFEVIFIMAF